MANLRNWQQSTTIVITASIGHRVSPPVDIDSMELYSKEDNQSCDANATRERRSHHIRILLPPPLIVVLYVVIDTKPDNKGWPSVGEVIRSPPKGPVQHDWDVDVANPGIGIAPGKEVEGDWK